MSLNHATATKLSTIPADKEGILWAIYIERQRKRIFDSAPRFREKYLAAEAEQRKAIQVEHEHKVAKKRKAA